jgi:ubiquinone/menaquinone biosynthesis C-methylase UbiE
VTEIARADGVAEDRHWWFASRTRALHVLMNAALPGRNLRVLDIGCGAGNMFHHLRRYGTVQGVEIDPRPVAMARRRGFAVEQGDASLGLACPEASFDLVTMLDVIEHIEDDRAVLREAARLLKPGGCLAVTVPAFMALWSHNDEINAHLRRYTAAELREKLREAGFNTLRLTYNNFFVLPFAATLILMRRRAGQAPNLASHHLSQDEYQVEMEPTSPTVNAVLTGVGWVEANLMRWVDLPVGTGILAVAQRGPVTAVSSKFTDLHIHAQTDN